MIRVIVSAFLFLCVASVQGAEPLPALLEVKVPGSIDQQPQPVRYWIPDKGKSEPVPVLVYLHSWSGDYTQDNSIWLAEAVQRGWMFLHPNFRGRNDHPEACGSKLARQDVLDALDYASQHFRLDPERVYLAGTSGGGHMAMLMAGHHPDRFSAVSAWVGISDLTAWHKFHATPGKPKNYLEMLEASCGGPPGKSPQVDAEYRDRSPIFWLAAAKDVPLDIAAGVNDGHLGSVPINHSLAAFNALAKAQRVPLITEEEQRQLWEWKRLKTPQPGDTAVDATFDRALLLRRTAGPSRVTIFQGDHEGLPRPACEWLSKQQRAVKLAKAPAMN